jgi:hypothetical protein
VIPAPRPQTALSGHNGQSSPGLLRSGKPAEIAARPERVKFAALEQRHLIRQCFAIRRRNSPPANKQGKEREGFLRVNSVGPG